MLFIPQARALPTRADNELQQVFCKVAGCGAFRVLPARFFAKVKFAESGCWLWCGSKCGVPGFPQHAYGQLRGWTGRKVMAHRFAYEVVIGPIPEHLEIDHLCNTKLCVNPNHLEAVEHAENMRRRPSPDEWEHRPKAPCYPKTECLRGHLFSEENTYIPADGRRRCRACNAIRQRKFQHGGQR